MSHRKILWQRHNIHSFSRDVKVSDILEKTLWKRARVQSRVGKRLPTAWVSTASSVSPPAPITRMKGWPVVAWLASAGVSLQETRGNISPLTPRWVPVTCPWASHRIPGVRCAACTWEKCLYWQQRPSAHFAQFILHADYGSSSVCGAPLTPLVQVKLLLERVLSNRVCVWQKGFSGFALLRALFIDLVPPTLVKKRLHHMHRFHQNVQKSSLLWFTIFFLSFLLILYFYWDIYQAWVLWKYRSHTVISSPIDTKCLGAPLFNMCPEGD